MRSPKVKQPKAICHTGGIYPSFASATPFASAPTIKSYMSAKRQSTND